MITMHKIEIQSKEEQLRKVEAEIEKQLRLIGRLIADRESAERVNNEGYFLNKLFSRRNTILNELKKQGKSELEIYARRLAGALD